MANRTCDKWGCSGPGEINVSVRGMLLACFCGDCSRAMLIDLRETRMSEDRAELLFELERARAMGGSEYRYSVVSDLVQARQNSTEAILRWLGES